MHSQEVKVDLKVCRRESGLLQSDLAVLLNTTQPRISRLERGKSVLTVEETVKLAVVFNSDITKLFKLLSLRMIEEVSKQLEHISPEVPNIPQAETRAAFLSQLFNRLQGDNAHVV